MNMHTNTGSAASLSLSGQALASQAAQPSIQTADGKSGQTQSYAVAEPVVQNALQHVLPANSDGTNTLEPGAKNGTPTNESLKLPAGYSERFAKLLYGFGLKASNENIGILRFMYGNGIPLTKENLQKMNHALKLTGSSEKALFMFENEMKLSTANSKILDGVVNGSMKISNMLIGLYNAIGEMPNKELREKLTEILTRPKESLEELVSKQNLPQQASRGSFAETITPVPVKISGASTAPHLINIAYLENFKALPEGQTPPFMGNMKQAGDFAMKVTLPQSEEIPTERTKQQSPQLLNSAGVLNNKTSQVAVSAESAVHTQNLPAGMEVTTPILNHVPNSATEVVPPANSETQANSINQNQALPTETINLKNLGHLFLEAGNNPLEIDRFFAVLRQRLGEIAATINESRGQETGRVIQSVREIANVMEFVSQIRNQIYVQLPMGFGDGVADMSLYVFRDAKKTSVHDGDGVSSAFVSLETANLGLFETFVQKKDKSVNCQFRVQNEETADLVREYISKLDILLGEQGLSLSGYGFVVSGNAFTVLDKPRSLSVQNVQNFTARGEIPQFDELV